MSRLSAAIECRILDDLDGKVLTCGELAERAGLSVHRVGEYLVAFRRAGIVKHRNQKWFVLSLEGKDG